MLRAGQLVELRDAAWLYGFESSDELIPYTLLKLLAVFIGEPRRYPELFNLATRQKLAVPLLANQQSMQIRAAALLGSSSHECSNPLMHNFSECPGIAT